MVAIKQLHANERMREYENLHILLWLLKDVCWLNIWQLGGLMMAVPTILVALHITWLKRHQMRELFHNIAVINWICANTVWMVGEFFYDDTLRSVSAVFFSLGFLVLAIYYLMSLRHYLRIRRTPIRNG